jgi:hypothetical protein
MSFGMQSLVLQLKFSSTVLGGGLVCAVQSHVAFVPSDGGGVELHGQLPSVHCIWLHGDVMLCLGSREWCCMAAQ